MKRVFDVVAAVCGLALTLPLLVLAMVVVRLTSPGPALFAHARIGRYGRPFTLYKLRSMYQGTIEAPTHEVDPAAVTRVGKLLRRSKLDEMPQLVNVILGDMSLVGPRPCLPSQVELIAARRAQGALDVRPGITGLAQIHGVDMSDPVRLAEIDGHYVRTRSFVGDLRLIVSTITGHCLGSDPAMRLPGDKDRARS